MNNRVDARKRFNEDWKLGLFDSDNKEETWQEYKKLYLKESKAFQRVLKKKKDK